MQTGESTTDSERPIIKTAENANMIAAAHAYFNIKGNAKDVITYKDLKEFQNKTNITDEKEAKNYTDTIKSIDEIKRTDDIENPTDDDKLSIKRTFTQGLEDLSKLEDKDALKNKQDELKHYLQRNRVVNKKTLEGSGTDLVESIAEKGFAKYRQKEGKKAFDEEQASIEKDAANKVKEQLVNKYGLSKEDTKDKSIDDIAKIAAEKEPLEEFEQIRDKEGNATGLVQRNIFSNRGRIGLGNRYEMKEMLKASGANYDDEELDQLTSDIAESFKSGKLVGGEFTQKAVGQLKRFMSTIEGVRALGAIRRGTKQAKQAKIGEKEAQIKEQYKEDYENTKSKIAEERLSDIEKNIEGRRQKGSTTEEAVKAFEKDKNTGYTESRIKSLEKIAGRESIISRMKEGDTKQEEKQKNNNQTNDPSQTNNNTKTANSSPIPNDAKEVKLVLQIGDELINAIAKIIKG